MGIQEKLMNIQYELKCNKSQYNSFGRYAYRSSEDILEAVKPLLYKYKATLVINDDIVLIGDRFYVKATSKITDIETGECVESTAFAREDESQKGMSSAQVTGSVSSYARKYSMNALFAIDDNKDADSTNTHGKDNEIKPNIPFRGMISDGISEAQLKRLYAIGNKAGFKKEVVEATVEKMFGCEPKDMTKDQYNTVCERLEKKVK